MTIRYTNLRINCTFVVVRGKYAIARMTLSVSQLTTGRLQTHVRVMRRPILDISAIECVSCFIGRNNTVVRM